MQHTNITSNVSSISFYEYVSDVITSINHGTCRISLDDGLLEKFSNNINPDLICAVKDNNDTINFINDFKKIRLNDIDLLIVIIKFNGILNEKLPLKSQLNILNLPINSKLNQDFSIDTIKSTINLGLLPYFEIINGSNDNSSNIIKKFKELSSSLKSESFKIPDLISSTHPKIKQFLQDQTRSIDIEDITFLNELTSICNNWVKEIQTFSKINHNSNILIEEIEFWNSIEIAILLIEKQIESPEIKTTLKFLNQARRFHTVLSFENDTGINEIKKQSNTFNTFFKDLPIQELIDIVNDSEFSKLQDSISDLFYHLKSKLSLLSIVEINEIITLFLNDIFNKFQEIYLSLNVMLLPMKEFEKIQKSSFEIINLLEENLKFISNTIREVSRRRQDKNKLLIDQSRLKFITTRLSELSQLRSNHENLINNINQASQNEESLTNLTSLENAYKSYLVPINVIDFSNEGNQIWLTNKKSYNEIYNSVFTTWISRINLYFDNAESFTDYLTIFDNFFSNKEYNSAMTILNDTYRLKILDFAFAEIQTLKDLTTNISVDEYSKILLYVELTSRLKFYTNHLQIMLGKEWNNYSIGQKIDTLIKNLFKKIDPNVAFENWVKTFTDMASIKNIGFIIKLSNVNGNYIVIPNTDFTQFQIGEKVHVLESLGFKMPLNFKLTQKKMLALRNIAYEISYQVTSFNQILQSPEQILKYIPDSIETLNELIKKVSVIEWSHISDAIDLINQNDEMLLSSESLIEIQSIRNLQELHEYLVQINHQLADLRNFHHFIEQQCHELKTCTYDTKTIESILKVIEQKFELSNLGNTGEKVIKSINDEIESILAIKLKTQLKIFINYLVPNNQEIEVVEFERYQTNFEKIKHQIISIDGTFNLSPTIAKGKNELYTSFNKIIKIVAKQRPISSTKLFSNIAMTNEVNDTFNDCLNEINSCYNEVEKYFIRWETFHNMLLMEDFENFFVEGDALKSYEILKTFFENEKLMDEPEKLIGDLITIDSKQIQARCSILYASFKKSILLQFSKTFETEVRKLKDTILQMKIELENPLVFHEAISLILKRIGVIFEAKNKIQVWENLISSFAIIQQFMMKHKFKFGNNWIFVDQLEFILSQLKHLLKEKQTLISKDLNFITTNSESEFLKAKQSLKILRDEWNVNKPISGDLNPSDVLLLLNKYQSKYDELLAYIKTIQIIAQELKFENFNFEESLEPLEDMKSLQTVWSIVNSFWEKLELLKSIEWSDLKPELLRNNLNDIITSIRNLPFNIRQYSAIFEIQSLVKNYLDIHSIIIDLKDSSLKKRHWIKLFDQLGSKLEDKLTVGSVWNLNLSVNFQYVREILEQARNESTIEESLIKIENNWLEKYFEFFNYENKCRLIKNWEDLFNEIDLNLDVIGSIKKSIYYTNFDQKVLEIENKLNSLNSILDVWSQTQSEWIHLNGVFGNDDNEVKNLLPIEHSRFQNLNYEYMTLLKRLYKFDKVIDIITITDLQATMSKYLKTLSVIQVSLSGYLEKQRDLFPRFFFLGNEDLLELIGSSNDITRINKHIKKMFNGIGQLKFDHESHSIVGIISGEGETFDLAEPVSLIKYSMLHEWLTQLESQIKHSLLEIFITSYPKWEKMIEDVDEIQYLELLKNTPNQISILLLQVIFTEQVENGSVDNYFKNSQILLQNSAKILKENNLYYLRVKLQNIIIELLHQTDIIDQLNSSKIPYTWEIQQKYYFENQKITMRQARCEFDYGFEYLGTFENLAYTPLIDKFFLTMTQALSLKLGGSPEGPAGTGKTESVKALGQNLGKMVIVFNCDEKFDFNSMGRIFLGLCRVGAWGCFDEFNRLDVKMLSAVSTQIETIQHGLKNVNQPIQLSNRECRVNPGTALFVTMNPGYSGRNELPENLKKLFRSFWMTKPDTQKIIEVLLTSQTFSHSNQLSYSIASFFEEILSNFTKQKHYDFGLRSIKSVINLCGNRAKEVKESNLDDESLIVSQSIEQMVLPKLVNEDVESFKFLQSKYFSNDQKLNDIKLELISRFKQFCQRKGLVESSALMEKGLQLCNIQSSNHGVMLVGDAGSGKSTVLEMVMNALTEFENTEHQAIVIEPKVMSKEQLFGKFDNFTKQWTDGLFTSQLRKVIDNTRGELKKRIWIVFDGRIDPIWAENLNSVLDNNKVFTLPTGERLGLPQNVTILFETDDLTYTTPATISRCGVIWFDKELISLKMLYEKVISSLRNYQPHKMEESSISRINLMNLQDQIFNQLKHMLNFSLTEAAYAESKSLEHIMSYSIHRAITFLEAMLKTSIDKFIDHSEDLKSVDIKFDKYASASIMLAMMWAFAGDCNIEDKLKFSDFIRSHPAFDSISPPPGNIMNYEIQLPDCNWVDLNHKIEMMDLNPHEINNPNLMIPTIDTINHENLIFSMLKQHTPMLLCGPPGSGKTMTLLKALTKAPDLELLALNFSKETTSNSLIKALENSCQYVKSNGRLKLIPKVTGKWLVVFCDEINLPMLDEYGNQSIISLINQMIKFDGFWSTKHMQWVTLENIQFVGACNSPNDPGRHVLSSRFLRHLALVMVDYPTKPSLNQIYQTFNNAIFKCAPDLKPFRIDITQACIVIYEHFKRHFSFKAPHYIYSPRELTRWCKGLYFALKSDNYTELKQFLRLWFHEGLRIFYDRLISEDDKIWTINLFHEIGEKHFPNVDFNECFKLPVFFSSWLSSKFQSCEKTSLKNFVRERLRVYNEEENTTSLILHTEMLDHILRLDRVLKQPQGNMILIGPSSSGKSTLSKFVAWINGLKVVQLKVKTGYTIELFDNMLRKLLLCCADGEKVCLLIDEASIVEATFVERMNILLANAEIPGLFEGESLRLLMKKCIERSKAQGLMLESEFELVKWFSEQISQNLHVIFTVRESPKSVGGSIISSPALFNRCVVNWMGDWSDDCLQELASELLSSISINPPTDNAVSSTETFKGSVISYLIFVHRNMSAERSFPKQFLTFVNTFINLYKQKQLESEAYQRRVITGLNKLRETMVEVDKLKADLSQKQQILLTKSNEARVMLNTMLVDQNEAERKHEFSIETQAELEKQKIDIKRRKDYVLEKLKYAEPAVLEAQRGVQNIKKQHLTEIRSMINPPNGVKLTMESVCIILGYNVTSWKEVQAAVRGDDFILNIVRYDCETHLTPELREYMEKTYLSRDDFTFEAVHRASKACGPLLEWVKAQLAYSKVLKDIGPLREEVRLLEKHTLKTKAQLIAIDEMIQELGQKIENCKTGYSELIREIERIKMNSETVKTRLEKSVKLINNLNSEKVRWSNSITTFEKQNNQLIGNILLSASSLTYACSLDEKDRDFLKQSWTKKLNELNISFDPALSVARYTLEREELKDWFKKGLTDDEVSTSNIASLKFNQYPILIDPTGSIVDLIYNYLSAELVTRTSFRSPQFMSNLENSMKFGGLLIVEDCEYYNPILNSYLGSTTQKMGGRMVLDLGEHVVDYNPAFKLILSTKRSTLVLSDYVKARATVINFAITDGSLNNISLNIALKFTNPSLESKRSDIIYAKNELTHKLETLEKELLQLLNTSTDKIVDSDEVMETLENLKKDGNEMIEKLDSTEKIMMQVNSVRSEYEELAGISTRVFNVLKIMSSISNFYYLSIEKFVKIYESVFDEGIKDPKKLLFVLYEKTMGNTSPSLTKEGLLILKLMLSISSKVTMFGENYKKVVVRLLFNPMVDKTEVMNICSNSVEPDLSLIKLLEEHSGDELDKKLPITKENHQVKPLTDFIFNNQWSNEDNFDHLLARNKLFIITSSKDYGSTFKIHDLAKAANKTTIVTSMGSIESSELANKHIKDAEISPIWVIVENVQMSSHWLESLDSQHLLLHEDSKLFLTCDENSQIPQTLIAKSQVLHFGDESSFKRNFLVTFKQIPSQFLKRAVHLRIFLLYTWFHNVLIEIGKYSPFTLTKKYDINESDFICGVHSINKIMTLVNDDEREIPFQEINYMICKIIYGGKINTLEDKDYVNKLAGSIFIMESLNSDFSLIETSKPLQLPNGNTSEDYVAWINELPDVVPTSWLNLDNDIQESIDEIMAKRAVDVVLTHLDNL
ncbi:DYN1 [Candida pseudojiufengensis]|uniref:DYN1 n=1 Tax=Candida pseudojiufengensis TaxID=497109 RepID=UPI002224D8A4|nr:DYN1 [Candida pseudojiufengensis]KAI5960962.1 DYN1 [Candida pseudojiufengensis]